MRIERDSMGEVEVPDDALYGASTQRAVDNFPISNLRFGRRFIWALGLIKAGVFGMILSSLACYHGLHVTGGAAGVGRATTNTVVQAVVAVIFADLMFTTLFYKVGW